MRAVKRLHLSYDMLIEYSVAVERCNFTIKCIPVDTMRQQVSNIQISIFPDVKYSYGKDGLNNTQIYGVNENAHTTFSFHIEADAITGLAQYESETNDDLDMIFRHEHGLNVAGEKIKAFYEETYLLRDLDECSKAKIIMHNLNTCFNYEPLSTDINTTAEEAFSQGKGVCQDYAHIFISLLHLAGISARYVTGFIVGEGQSHAWVEILCDNKWYGLDPTHDRIVGDDYIKIGVGRDAKDCMINRGIMHGGGLHTQAIAVNLKELE